MSGFLMVCKRDYKVQLSKPPIGTKVHNFLEDADYVTDEKQPYVLKGTQGEEWCISLDKLRKGYDVAENPDTALMFMSPQQITTKPGGTVTWAKLVPVENGTFQVSTSWGTVLTGNRPGIPHGFGDIIMAADDNGQPSMTDRWIVNGAVFMDTYKLVP